MKRILILIGIISFGVYLAGCGKKETAIEEGAEPMTMEALSTVNITQPVNEVKPTEVKSVEAKAASAQATTQPANLASLPPAGPFAPIGKDIQTALKNAGFYTGEIDGKIGPMSKKAIEAFQQANGLKADGKVGPKTWALLSKYLNPASAPVATTNKR